MLTLPFIYFDFLQEKKKKKSSSYLNFFYVIVTFNQSQKPSQSAEETWDRPVLKVRRVEYIWGWGQRWTRENLFWLYFCSFSPSLWDLFHFGGHKMKREQGEHVKLRLGHGSCIGTPRGLCLGKGRAGEVGWECRKLPQQWGCMAQGARALGWAGLRLTLPKLLTEGV